MRGLLVAVSSALLLASPLHAQSWLRHLDGPRAAARLDDGDPTVRLAAARALGVQGESRRAVLVLLARLEQEDSSMVRRAIVQSLARRGDPFAVRPLAAEIADWPRDDRVAGLRGLAGLGGDEPARLIAEWLADADVGDEAALASIRVGAPAVPHLIHALAAPASVVRAARALGQIGDARATEPLLRTLAGAAASLRPAILAALGELGDARAVPSVQDCLRDESLEVIVAALDALRLMSDPASADAVAPLLEASAVGVQAAALRALVHLDPARAALAAERALGPEAPRELAHAATDAVLEEPSAPLLVALGILALDPEHAAEAADALGRVDRGAGIGALSELATRGTPYDVALAVALRRQRAWIASGTRGHALAVLGNASLRARVLRAVAGDESVWPELVSALSGEERARAAIGLVFLTNGARAAQASIWAALRAERDPSAFRALALAAGAAGLVIDPLALRAHWEDPATAPEALWLGAQSWAVASPRARTHLLAALHRALRAPDPRVRSSAALSLARVDATLAWHALAGALDDPDDGVRIAAARALSRLARPEMRAELAARERIESDRRVRDVLRDALDPLAPRALLLRGDDTLFVRVTAAPGLEVRPVAADLRLPDGRWLRVPTQAGGEVLLPNLPSAEAEVLVRTEP